jgi:hypothetical protein
MLQTLFDEKGRCHKSSQLQSSVSEPDNEFYLIQPKIDNAERLNVLHDYLGQTEVSTQQFQSTTELIKEQTLSKPNLANLFKGVHLPIVLPGGCDNLENILQDFLLAINVIYQGEISRQRFINMLPKHFYEKVKLFKISRQNLLIRKLANKSVIGWYFPNPLQGFSILAQREQMIYLPHNLILSGIDTLIALIMYPDVLAKDDYTPFYNLSAFSYESEEKSIGFEANDKELLFFSYNTPDYSFCDCTGGLFLM